MVLRFPTVDSVDGILSPKILIQSEDSELIDFLMENLKTFCGTCPDQSCSTQVFFLKNDDTVTCHKCLQTHAIDSLINKFETEYKDHEIHDIHDFGRDFVRVNGLSNFQCKLLSPFLTTFGMDKMGKAVPLQEIAGHADTIDCGQILGNRSFKISTSHIDIYGFGKDCSGSLNYLADFLEMLKAAHGGDERLLPIHVDGDGHCLVHALSRALTGRELFWHSLRKNLYDHLRQRLSDYTVMFRDFHDEADFQSIIEEANPDADSGIDFTAGLGNIHIFALSNILRRPIMLLDSPQKMQNAGDYTGLFLPVFTAPEDCKNKSPICIAWSGAAHNHFVPLVPIEGKPLPTIPASLIPRLWGVAPEMGQRYLNYNDDGSLCVGDGRPISTSYLQRLTAAMERKFLEQYMVSPSLVEDCSRYLYKLSDYPTLQPKNVINLAKVLASDERLYRCLTCKSLCNAYLEEEWFKPGGQLYDLAVSCHQTLNPKKLYTFPIQGPGCEYDAKRDRLVVVAHFCQFCQSFSARLINAKGDITYRNGDLTDTPSSRNGNKAFWNGKEYDNQPHNLTVKVPINETNDPHDVEICWFYGDSNPELNSDARTEAEKIARQHFSESPNYDRHVIELENQIREKTQQLHIGNVSEPSARLATSRSDHRVMQPRKQEHVSLKPVEKNSLSLPLLTGSSTSDTPTSSSSLSAPHKRKSNGEPTDPPSAATVSKLPVTGRKCVVKISQCGGATKTVPIEPLIDMAGFQKKVEELFGIEPTRQILKHGYPPKVLEAPSSGGALGLKSGDKITLNVREKSSLTKSDPCQKPMSKSFDYFVHCNEFDQDTRRKELLEGCKLSHHSSMWDYAMERPELFYPGGYFYEQFKVDIGLQDRQHCKLPLLEGLVFCYNEKHDRVELCLEPILDHYPIDDEIPYRYKRYRECKSSIASSVCEAMSQSSSSSRDHNEPKPPEPQVSPSRDYLNMSQSPQPQEKSQSRDLNIPQSAASPPSFGLDPPESSAASEDSKITESSGRGNMAPGYHTVGEVPTQLSAKDIHLQRESIRQMVEKIQSKQSSS